jgi:hypothetical protein
LAVRPVLNLRLTDAFNRTQRGELSADGLERGFRKLLSHFRIEHGMQIWVFLREKQVQRFPAHCGRLDRLGEGKRCEQ